jgi:pyruvate dehydrogenase kinase 2/3/4
VQQVSSWYKQSFKQLVESPAPVDQTKEKHFSRLIEDIYDRHSATLITMAKGAQEIKLYLKYDTKTFSEQDEVQRKLDDFYMSRIGIRILLGQYLSLRSQPASDDMIGLISLKCSCHDIAREAISDASYMCTRVHGDAPEVILKGPDLHFAQIPTHLKYILLELLKNSMRATIEKHGIDNMPPIKIIVSDGKSKSFATFYTLLLLI